MALTSPPAPPLMLDHAWGVHSLVLFTLERSTMWLDRVSHTTTGHYQNGKDAGKEHRLFLNLPMPLEKTKNIPQWLTSRTGEPYSPLLYFSITTEPMISLMCFEDIKRITLLIHVICYGLWQNGCLNAVWSTKSKNGCVSKLCNQPDIVWDFETTKTNVVTKLLITHHTFHKQQPFSITWIFFFSSKLIFSSEFLSPSA